RSFRGPAANRQETGTEPERATDRADRLRFSAGRIEACGRHDQDRDQRRRFNGSPGRFEGGRSRGEWNDRRRLAVGHTGIESFRRRAAAVLVFSAEFFLNPWLILLQPWRFAWKRCGRLIGRARLTSTRSAASRWKLRAGNSSR